MSATHPAMESPRPSPWRARAFLLVAAMLTAGCDLGTKAWAFRALEAEVVTVYLVQTDGLPESPLRRAWSPPGPTSRMRIVHEGPGVSQDSQSVTVIPGCFDFRPSVNTGAVFGLGSGRTGWVMLFTLVALGLIGWIIWSADPRRVWLHIGFGLVVGGAAGNLWDRLQYSGVRDFIHWYASDPDRNAWPTFNIADAALCVGIGLILLLELRQPSAGKAASTPTPAAS